MKMEFRDELSLKTKTKEEEMIDTKHLFIGKRERGIGETDYLILDIGPLTLWLTKSLYGGIAKKNYPRLVIWWGKPNLVKGIGVKKTFCLRITKPYLT